MPSGLTRRTRLFAAQVSGVLLAQVVGMVVQLGYTAVTARTFSPASFGYYGIALAVSAPIGILAGLGLGNAAARRTEEDEVGDRAICGTALASGAGLALLLAALSYPLAQLYGAPSAAPFIMVISITVLLGPYAGVLMGILRRLERIADFTRITVASSLVGLMVGWVAVTATKQPLALCVLPVTTQASIALLASVRVGRRSWPVLPSRRSWFDTAFGMRSMALSLMASTSAAVPTWALSRTLGPSTFGAWNRAITVGTLPVESVNRAFITVAYPRFRRADADDVGSMWTDILSASVWLLVVPACVMVPVMPAFVSVLMGPGWELAASMAQWLWVIAALTIPVTALAAALESSNNFSALWAGQFAMLVVYLGGAVLVLITEDWVWAAVCLLVGILAAHAFHVSRAADRRLVQRKDLLRWYGSAGLASVPLVLITWGMTRAISQDVPQLLYAALIAGLYLGCLWLVRQRMGPIRRLMLAPGESQ